MKYRLFALSFFCSILLTLFSTANAIRYKPSLINYTAIHYIMDNETGAAIPSLSSTVDVYLTPNALNTSLPPGKSEFTFTTAVTNSLDQSEINLTAKDVAGNAFTIATAVNFKTWNYCSYTSNNMVTTCRTRTEGSIYNVYVTIK
ncbi:MAG: hypothetical protein A3E87_03145 [Gammaproteobacteria bacterium RIFCSPHIGHO2_12_FULL_35_23]|nr:MAG: hypothetical protein A3E87_03145 [Gammaproteobacteria bacterium RIFCSPHIGHO2_12_FULL_35_23]